MTDDDTRGFALGFCVAVLRPPMAVLTRRDWAGTEHLPESGGCVVAVNHISEFDPLVVAHYIYAAGRLPRLLGKAEVFAVPLLGRVLASAGQIPVSRHTDDAAQAFQAAVDAVRAGRCVVVYPEGTITKDPDLWPMVGKTGAARIALATDCPLLPMAQWGAQDVLARNDWRPHLLPRKLMTVRLGGPIDMSDLRQRAVDANLLTEATGRVMSAITQLLEGIRAETAPRERFDPRTAGSVPPTGRPETGKRRGRSRRRGRDAGESTGGRA